MTEEQKEKLKEYNKRRYQNRTEEQKEERKVKRNEYNKRYRQNMTEEQKNKTITPTPKTNTPQKYLKVKNPTIPTLSPHSCKIPQILV